MQGSYYMGRTTRDPNIRSLFFSWELFRRSYIYYISFHLSMAFHQYRCRSNAISMPRPCMSSPLFPGHVRELNWLTLVALSLNTSKPALSLSIPKTPTALPTSRRTSPPTPSSHVPVAYFNAPPLPPRLSIPTDLPSISMPRAPVLENSHSPAFFNYPQRSASPPPPSSSDSNSLSRPKLSPRDERAKIVAGLILNRHSTKRSCPLGGAALRACHNRRYVNTPLRVEVC